LRSDSKAPHRRLTGLGNTAGTIHTGSATGPISVAKPALIATGTHAGDAGTLTISSDPTLATLLPAQLPPPTADGAPFATFSPDGVTGQTVDVTAKPAESIVDQVYLRGSGWAPAFKTYLADQSLGDAALGYRIDTTAPDDIVPWINVNEIILHYAAPPTAGGGAPGGASYTRTINVLQGDVDKSGSVLANDFSNVKKKFFKSTASPGSGDTRYTVFHDVDGSGSILANDFSEVKKRFFDNLPAVSPSGAPARVLAIPRDLFSTRALLD
jgi:hypothetical protein